MPKPQSEATGLEPGAQHLVIALLAFSSLFSPSGAKREKKKRCFKWKEYEKRPLTASFKRLLGNRIVSMKQNCDCLEEVNAGQEWGEGVPHTFPSPAPAPVGGCSLACRVKEPPGLLPEL